MVFLLALAAAVVAAEILIRLARRGIHSEMAGAMRRSLHTVRRPHVSDHWRQRAILGYSGTIVRGSARMALWLVALAAAVAITIAVAATCDIPLLAFLLSTSGLVYVTAAATVYFFVRCRPSPVRHAYGPADRLLHRIALGSSLVARASYDIEQSHGSFVGEAVASRRHIFVAGLARAGTTVLMRRLHATGRLTSLTYRDMPFVLMPGLWAKITASSRREGVRQERAHGDGVLIDYDSPEVLEEVFWRVFAGKRYIHGDALTPMPPCEETIEQFRRYVAAILARDGEAGPDRYLSKNNNNILRLSSIRSAFPQAAILVPFRDPVQQAHSLLTQHRRFVEFHRTSPFARQYMSWLAHHEFGSDHRRFRFTATVPAHADPYTLNYWVELWDETYAWLLETVSSEVLFVSYERLCCEFEYIWPRLARVLDVPASGGDAECLVVRDRTVTELVDPQLLQRAQAVHASLLDRMATWLSACAQSADCPSDGSKRGC